LTNNEWVALQTQHQSWFTHHHAGSGESVSLVKSFEVSAEILVDF
jgi:hypothetical protein